MSKIFQSTELIECDGNSGVITRQESNRVIRWEDEPGYVKLYLQEFPYLSGALKQYAPVILSLLKRLSYAGGERGMCVVLTTDIKNDVCFEVGLQRKSSLDNILHELIKGKIMFRVGRGIYQFNPYLFGRGQWPDIAKIRKKVDYIPGDRQTFSHGLIMS